MFMHDILLRYAFHVAIDTSSSAAAMFMHDILLRYAFHVATAAGRSTSGTNAMHHGYMSWYQAFVRVTGGVH